MTTEKTIKNKWLECLSSLALFILLSICSSPFHAAEAGRASANATKKPERGFLKRIYDEVQGNSNHWVERFCELALSQKGEDYAHFVQLARAESIVLNNEERQRQLVGTHPFSHYVNDDNRNRAYQCLEHGGAHAPAIIQYELYMLIGFDVSGRRYYWLKRAAEGGVANAQVDIAWRIYPFLGSASREPPEDLRDEIKPERFYYWLKRAADSGLPRGIYELATLHFGRYSEHTWSAPYYDVSLAIQMLEKIARETRDVAMKARADNQSKTWVIPESIESDALIRSRAVAYLGEQYFQGKHVPQDYGFALKWFSEVDEVYVWHCRAPAAGVRYRLLSIYEKGLGTEKNPGKVRYYSQHLRLGC